MRAVAVAASRVDGAGHVWRVRSEDKSRSKEKRGEECEPQECATDPHLDWERRNHGGSLWEERKKTDGAEELGGSGQRF
jgi:hypothetical protein